MITLHLFPEPYGYDIISEDPRINSLIKNMDIKTAVKIIKTTFGDNITLKIYNYDNTIRKVSQI